jgi:DNA-binding PadR family transcriptional regulator
LAILTLNEETILIALCRLGGEGHGPGLRDKLIELTGRSIVYGTLYNSLEYLIRKGYVDSHRGEPTPERGGKAKSVYRITDTGREALLETRDHRDHLWKGLNEADIDPGKPVKS